MSVHKKRMKLSHDETNKFLTENATLTKITEEEFVSVRDTIFSKIQKPISLKLVA